MRIKVCNLTSGLLVLPPPLSISLTSGENRLLTCNDRDYLDLQRSPVFARLKRQNHIAIMEVEAAPKPVAAAPEPAPEPAAPAPKEATPEAPAATEEPVSPAEPETSEEPTKPAPKKTPKKKSKKKAAKKKSTAAPSPWGYKTNDEPE